MSLWNKINYCLIALLVLLEGLAIFDLYISLKRGWPIFHPALNFLWITLIVIAYSWARTKIKK